MGGRIKSETNSRRGSSFCGVKQTSVCQVVSAREGIFNLNPFARSLASYPMLSPAALRDAVKLDTSETAVSCGFMGSLCVAPLLLNVFVFVSPCAHARRGYF
jgi:hypothetical protein